MDSAQKRTEHLNPYNELTVRNSKVRCLDPIFQSTFWSRNHQTYRLQFSTNNPFTPNYVTSNLSLSSDPAGMYASRVKGRQILLENPARESKAMKKLEEKRMRKKRDKGKKKLGIIGKREAKEKGIWKFDDAQAKSVPFLLFFFVFLGCVSDHVFFLECQIWFISPSTSFMDGVHVWASWSISWTIQRKWLCNGKSYAEFGKHASQTSESRSSWLYNDRLAHVVLGIIHLLTIENLSPPKQESLSLRSLRNRDPWNWECVQSRNEAW